MNGIGAFLGFASIAGLTWLFSFCPRLFVGLFVPRENWFGSGREMLRKETRRGMRLMALVQFLLGCIVGLVCFCMGI